jgi:hypothetical protein
VARPQRTLEKKINGPLGSEGSALKADPSEIQKAYEYLFAMSSISLHNAMILIVTHIPVVTTHNPLVRKFLVAKFLTRHQPPPPIIESHISQTPNLLRLFSSAFKSTKPREDTIASSPPVPHLFFVKVWQMVMEMEIFERKEFL